MPLPLICSVGLFQSDQYLVERTDHLDCDPAHLTNEGYEALYFEANRPFAADRFQCFLEELSDHVFRAKGVLWIKGAIKNTSFSSSVKDSPWTRCLGSADDAQTGADRSEPGPRGDPR